MGNTNIMRPIGAMDRLAHQEVRPSASTSGSASHGDVVVEALSVPVRFLIGAVLVTNLSLGAWLLHRSDFSELEPQAVAEPAEKAATKSVAPHHVEGAAPQLTIARANDRD